MSERSANLQELARTTRAGGSQGWLPSDDDDAIAALRQVLSQAGYTGEVIRETLGITAEVSFNRSDLPIYLRRLPECRLSTLIKLFLLGATVNGTEVARSLDPAQLEIVERLGLVESSGAGVKGTVGIIPYDGLFLCYDRSEDLEVTPADQVIGVNPTSVTLSSLTVRMPVRSALDLGSGCGVQALLAARHSGHSLGVDINPRAIRVATFNARLNDIPNAEFRQGDMFARLPEETFDLVVSNPPFVISPESRFLYRDSVLTGDAVCSEAARRVPPLLSEGGFATILCNWAASGGDVEWWSRPLEWAADTGCDAWVLRHRTEDPLTYAATWNRPLQVLDPPAYSSALDRWLGYYRELGITAINYGALIMRKRSSGGSNWGRADEMPSGVVGSAGDHILRVFDAYTHLANLEDNHALLGEAFTLRENATLQQVLKSSDGRLVMRDAFLRLDEGLKFEGRADAYAVHLLTRCDGRRPLGTLVAELAESAGAPLEEISSAALPVFRRLFALGFLDRGAG